MMNTDVLALLWRNEPSGGLLIVNKGGEQAFLLPGWLMVREKPENIFQPWKVENSLKKKTGKVG